VHDVVRANIHASWIWRGRPEDHPLAVARQRADRKRELKKLRAVIMRLVAVVRDILRTGRPTPFAHEGSTRTALRCYFILHEHRSWRVSDLLAKTVVEAALDTVGARRPSWWESQPEFTRLKGTSCTYCANPECGRPIGRQNNNPTLKFCCEQCRVQTKARRLYQTYRERNVAHAQAKRDAQRAAAELRACEWCSLLFRPLDDSRRPQRFCSKTCRSRYASSCAASWRPYKLPHQRDRQGRFIQSA
jgi:hypothetical protein